MRHVCVCAAFALSFGLLDSLMLNRAMPSPRSICGHRARLPSECSCRTRTRRARRARGRSRSTRRRCPKLAANPLYDYVFLNLEGSYDAVAVKAIAEGLGRPDTPGRKTLIVRIPAFHADPAASRARIREIVAAGGDGITFPHVQTLDEAKQILAAFQEAKVNVWSADNPKGDKLAMMMLEDPEAVAQAAAFAVKGYSILACGIGSLTQALKGDRAGAEAGTRQSWPRRSGRAGQLLTATTQDVEQRVSFLGILARGPNADEAIKIGRAAPADSRDQLSAIGDQLRVCQKTTDEWRRS